MWTNLALGIGLVSALTPIAPPAPLRHATVRVVVKCEGQPVDKIEVYVESSDGAFRDRKATNVAGVAHFDSVPRGELLIQVTDEAYKSATASCEVKEDVSSCLIKLQRKSAPRPDPEPPPR